MYRTRLRTLSSHRADARVHFFFITRSTTATRHMIATLPPPRRWYDVLCNFGCVWYVSRGRTVDEQKKKFNRAHISFRSLYLRWLIVVNWNWMRNLRLRRRAHSRAWLACRLSPRNENVKKKWNKEFQNEIYNITIGPELRLRNVELCSTMFTTRTYADDCVVSLFFSDIFFFSFPFYTNISRRALLSALSAPERFFAAHTFQFHTYIFSLFLNIIAWIFLVATAEQLELNIDFDFLVCSASFPLFFFLLSSSWVFFPSSPRVRERSFARGGKWKLNKRQRSQKRRAEITEFNTEVLQNLSMCGGGFRKNHHHHRHQWG